MSPRERAEALGWVGDDDGAWVAPGMVVWLGIDDSWWVWGVRFATEDEALEHALLLLDVWLS